MGKYVELYIFITKQEHIEIVYRPIATQYEWRIENVCACVCVCVREWIANCGGHKNHTNRETCRASSSVCLGAYSAIKCFMLIFVLLCYIWYSRCTISLVKWFMWNICVSESTLHDLLSTINFLFHREAKTHKST